MWNDAQKRAAVNKKMNDEPEYALFCNLQGGCAYSDFEQVTFDQWIQHTETEQTPVPKDNLKKIFDKYDARVSGSLTYPQFKQMRKLYKVRVE